MTRTAHDQTVPLPPGSVRNVGVDVAPHLGSPAMASHAPDGYHSITPYFTVEDADRLISFLVCALDGQIVKEDRNDRDRVRHARVRIGDSIIMLNEAAPGYEANRSQIHLYVTDVETAFAAALREGATAVMEPNLRPHGDRMAGFETRATTRGGSPQRRAAIDRHRIGDTATVRTCPRPDRDRCQEPRMSSTVSSKRATVVSAAGSPSRCSNGLNAWAR